MHPASAAKHLHTLGAPNSLPLTSSTTATRKQSLRNENLQLGWRSQNALDAATSN